MTKTTRRWIKRTMIASAMLAVGAFTTLGGATEAQARGCGGHGYGGGYGGGWGGGYGYAPSAVVVSRPAYGYNVGYRGGYRGYGGYRGPSHHPYRGHSHNVGYGSLYSGRGISIGFGF